MPAATAINYYTPMELVELNNGTQQQANNENGANFVNMIHNQTLNPIHHHHHHHQMQQYTQHIPQQHQQPIKHRELPVDVPDSFVGVAKQSPRYPPPKPNRQISPAAAVVAASTAPVVANNHFSHPTHQSIRDSIKLKQLEKQKGFSSATNGSTMHSGSCAPGSQSSAYPTGMPVVNKAFEFDEGDSPNDDRFEELMSIYNDKRLDELLSVYYTVIRTVPNVYDVPNLTSKHLPNTTFTVSELADNVQTALRQDGMTNDAAELLSILAKYELEGVANAFDSIMKTFDLNEQLSPQALSMQQQQHHQTMSYDSQGFMDVDDRMEDVDLGEIASIRNVCIEKASCQPLGATIRRDDTTGNIIIARLLCHGAALESGLFDEGDIILEVNRIRMRGRSTDEVVNILNDMDGTLNFTIGVRSFLRPPPKKKLHRIVIKAFFDYDGSMDAFVPCKDLCLNFKKGDILTIVDQSDPNWWQAYPGDDPSGNPLTYLIPSFNFLQQRERIYKDTSGEDNNSNYFKHEKKSPMTMFFNCGKSSSLKKRKKSLKLLYADNDMPYYYETLTTYYPFKYFKRPIILVGPNLIGRKQILNKLLKDRERFSSVIAHTSKPRKEDERQGYDFYFISRSQFEADIKAGKFIEYGRYDNHYYGTSYEEFKKVVDTKKICVHLINGSTIKNFRQGEAGARLKPYFVFLKPHYQIEKLQNFVSTIDTQVSHADLQKVIDEAQILEDQFKPFFDKIITVTDIEQVYQELLQAIAKIENDPQWIPAIWETTPK